MKRLRKFFVVGLLIICTNFAHAAKAGELQKVFIDVSNKKTLQRGAKLFMNYCSGCHSLQYLRYSRMAKDIGLIDNGKVDEDLLNANLIFTSASSRDSILTAMPADDARRWFGVTPPDLSLIARARETNWLYSYLKNFYRDNSRPFGVNNGLVINTAMPDALEPLMGISALMSDANHYSIQLLEQGEVAPLQADMLLEDLVTFLSYAAEPAQLIRFNLGIKVLLFLCLLLIPVYQLKKLYWRRLKK